MVGAIVQGSAHSTKVFPKAFHAVLLYHQENNTSSFLSFQALCFNSKKLSN